MFKNRLIAVFTALFVAFALAGSAPASAEPVSCEVSVNLQGINVQSKQVRVGDVSASAKLTVNVASCGVAPYTYDVTVPKLGLVVSDLTGSTVNKTVTVYSAGLTNADAGVITGGKVTFFGGDSGTPTDPVAFSVTPLRYTSWTGTNASPEPIDAGESVFTYAQLKVADWNSNTTVAFGNRLTRLQRRTTPDMTYSSGVLVRGDSAGKSRRVVQLGEDSDVADKTIVLRYAYNGNASAGFAPNWAYGDAVLVRAQD